MCSSGGQNRQPAGPLSQTHNAEEEPQDEDVDDYVEKVISSVNSVGVQGTVKPYKTMLEVEGQRITMEIDTGAVVSLISQETQRAYFQKLL